MGNAESEIKGKKYQLEYSNVHLYDIKEKKYSDVFDQEVVLHGIRESKPPKCIAKIRKMNEQNQIDQEQENYLEERIKDNQNPNLLQLYGYCSNVQSDTMCGSSYNHFYYVEYPIASLRDEIEHRRNSNPPKPYTERELWGVLYSIVSGLVSIKEKNKKCRNISSSHIYINADGYYQICEQGLLEESSLFESIMFKHYSKDKYLSPDQMKSVKEGKFVDETDPFLSDIYSLAIVITEMCYLEEQGDIYRYYGQNVGYDEDKMKVRISHLEQKYQNKKLIRLLQNMTETLEKKRIQLDELKQELERNFHRLIQGTTKTDLSDYETHTTNCVPELRNRQENDKKRQNIVEVDQKKPKYKRNTTQRFNNEDEGEERRSVKNSNYASLNHINEQDINSSQISSTKGSKIFKSEINRSKQVLDKVTPLMSLSSYMIKRNQEKQNLLQKQKELELIEYKSAEQKQEIQNIENQIQEIDKSIQNEKNQSIDGSKSQSPGKTVHFQQDSPNTQGRQIIQSKVINVHHSLRQNNVDEHDEGIRQSRPMEVSRMSNSYKPGNDEGVYNSQFQNGRNMNRIKQINSRGNSPSHSQNNLEETNQMGSQNQAPRQYQMLYNQVTFESPGNQQDSQYQNSQQPLRQQNPYVLNSNSQNPQYGELFNQRSSPHNLRSSPIPHRNNLDRYDQRLSKNNVCTDRYNKLNDLFNEDSTNIQQKKSAQPQNYFEDSEKKFKNKVIKKQSINQILISNIIKQDNLSPIQPNQGKYDENVLSVPNKLSQNMHSNSAHNLSQTARELIQAVPNENSHNFTMSTNRNKFLANSKRMNQ